MTNEGVKPVLNTFAGFEPNPESPPLSFNDAKDVTSNLINGTAAIQDPKYHVFPANQ